MFITVQKFQSVTVVVFSYEHRGRHGFVYLFLSNDSYRAFMNNSIVPVWKVYTLAFYIFLSSFSSFAIVGFTHNQPTTLKNMSLNNVLASACFLLLSIPPPPLIHPPQVALTVKKGHQVIYHFIYSKLMMVAIFKL